ncbi:DUF488 domain-containing protein [Methanomassiliicoccus luminyensis]|jgi:uncharacterized protein (DUF488 family)|uniref:DUF488 domain-containing protein n=1 Tax=Methanomassiliicoccus luminyensis TaxID=1080712 RepID=UPI000362BB3B|nr:DUF488 domain-containing protein [Methanomassiliicoccus luminyensis]
MPSSRVWTVGYEGRTLQDILSLVRSYGLEVLIDVRESPYSRRKGFSQRPLREALERTGVEYVHMPELGTPKELRRAIIDPEEYRFRYLEHLKEERGTYEQLLKIVSDRPSVLLCFERDFKDCHRGLIAERLAEDGMDVVHL